MDCSLEYSSRQWHHIDISTLDIDIIFIGHYMVYLNGIIVRIKMCTALTLYSPIGFVKVSPIIYMDRQYSDLPSPLLTDSRHLRYCISIYLFRIPSAIIRHIQYVVFLYTNV